MVELWLWPSLGNNLGVGRCASGKSRRKKGNSTSVTTEPSIRLDRVNLLYASTGFNDRSLKGLVMSCFRTAPLRQDVHALKDVSLSIAPGERVGLIGRNGAGKSTLLKVIAGLYPIESGRVLVRGSTRALLNLSLGFEPDATGRENILYRGLLLGMTPRQIRSIANEIVDFAELGAAIDYPLKTYSAGMQVRLAFAISTVAGADILLLDEVLGAGDAGFMIKAKARLARLIAGSSTLVLASHDLSALSSLCDRGVFLHNGRIISDGPIGNVLADYNSFIADQLDAS